MQNQFDEFMNTRSIEGTETLEQLTTSFQEYVAEQAALLDIRTALASTLGQCDCMDEKENLQARRDYWANPEDDECERVVENQIAGCDILLNCLK